METIPTNQIVQEWQNLGSITVYSEPNPWGRIYQRSGLLFMHHNAHETIYMLFLDEDKSYSGNGFYFIEKGNFSVDDRTYNCRTQNNYSHWYFNLNL